MFDLSLWLTGLWPILGLAVIAWVLSLWRRDASVVDSFWSLFILAAGLTYIIASSASSARTTLVTILLSAWALRLAVYLTWRNRGEGEDRRYRKIRANNQPGYELKSLYLVFGFQALLAWLVSLPLLASAGDASPLGWLDYAGLALWTLGMVFEVAGDHQLARFRADPANRGQVLDRGLWRYTRHPNYFGEFCVWWGFFLIALSAGGWWSVISPLLMSFLLMRFSGVTLLESDIGERRPAYREYVKRTNAFFPGPRRGRSTNRGVPADA